MTENGPRCNCGSTSTGRLCQRSLESANSIFMKSLNSAKYRSTKKAYNNDLAQGFGQTYGVIKHTAFFFLTSEQSFRELFKSFFIHVSHFMIS